MDDKTSCYISNNILKRIEKLELKQPYSYLVSLMRCELNECYIVSCLSPSSPSSVDDTSNFIPEGLEICGLCMHTPEASSQSAVEDLFRKQKEAASPINQQSCLVLAFDKSNPEETHLYQQTDGCLTKTNYKVVESDSFNSWIRFRLQASVPASFEHSEDKDELLTNIKAELKRLQSDTQRSTTAFNIADSSAILFSEGGACCNISAEAECSQLFTVIDNDRVERTKKQRKAGDFSQDVVHVGLLCERSGRAAAEHSVPCAPVIHHEHREYKQTSVELPLDVVVYAHATEPISVLPTRLLTALHRQLAAMETCMLRHLSKCGQMFTPEVFHFEPDDYHHVVSVVYPKSVSEDSLEEERREAHARLQLPADRPCVRRLNAYRWPDETVPGGYLLNVHKGLAPSKVKEGRAWLVQGDYAYHHYMQDRFNDDKWGCAYRSLQTLVSWFRLQGYTDKPVPTHSQIQQILVDINDKPAKIVGSKTWIGSTEVSYVLDTYLGIQKIKCRQS